MSAILARLQPVKTLLGERLWVASSCSLLHSPVDLDLEGDLSAETRSWFAFAKQKVTEVALLGRALEGDAAAILACDTYSQPIVARKSSHIVNKASVQTRINNITAALAERSALTLSVLITKRKCWVCLSYRPQPSALSHKLVRSVLSVARIAKAN